MKNLKIKLIMLLVVILGILSINISVYATNENIEIIEKDSGEYILYIKNYLNTDFQFAFSNDKNVDRETLIYSIAETDSTSTNANKIAFINSATRQLFSNPTYMWAKDSEGNYFVNGTEIDLSKSIHEYNLELAINITTLVPVDTSKVQTTVEEKDGKKITTTVGKVELDNPVSGNSYSYILIKESNSEDYEKIIDLGTRISKFNSETDMNTKISVYKEFLTLFNKLVPNHNDTNWSLVENNQILQPVDAQDGERYVLWIKQEENGTIINQDMQILTSTKEYSEERIVETITTKLPVTYDNNILLFALALLVLATLGVFIKIKLIEKKEKSRK